MENQHMCSDEPGRGPGRGRERAPADDDSAIAWASRPSDAELVEPHEVERLVDEGMGLLDLREPQAFAAAHLPGAVNVRPDDLIERASRARGAVILYDEDGGLIAGRCDALRRAVGEMEFFVLRGGLRAWRAADLPVEGR